IVELVGFVILMLISILSRGNMGIAGGLVGCLLVILAFFGVMWGVLSYDDVKSNQRFKFSGICLNVIVIFLGITLLMLLVLGRMAAGDSCFFWCLLVCAEL